MAPPTAMGRRRGLEGRTRDVQRQRVSRFSHCLLCGRCLAGLVAVRGEGSKSGVDPTSGGRRSGGGHPGRELDRVVAVGLHL